MEIRPLSVEGVLELTPRIFTDDRGTFAEVFKRSLFQEHTADVFPVLQINTSESVRNTLRGIHTSTTPPGQAKYVMCASGEIEDYVVDLRVGSPTFMKWTSVTLTSTLRNSVYIPAGLGHAFVARSDHATVVYACSSEYNPTNEFAVNPFDVDLGINWCVSKDDAIVSPKDMTAPMFGSQDIQERLPRY